MSLAVALDQRHRQPELGLGKLTVGTRHRAVVLARPGGAGRCQLSTSGRTGGSARPLFDDSAEHDDRAEHYQEDRQDDDHEHQERGKQPSHRCTPMLRLRA